MAVWGQLDLGFDPPGAKASRVADTEMAFSQFLIRSKILVAVDRPIGRLDRLSQRPIVARPARTSG